MEFIIKPGNLKEGGSLRARGESEPIPSTNYDESKLATLENLLKNTKLGDLEPVDVLEHPELERFIKLPPGFPWGDLNKYLKVLAKRQKEKNQNKVRQDN